MSRLYGLFADLTDRDVLVIGGGEIAERKITSLLKAGARVSVIAPEMTDALTKWHQAGQITHRATEFLEGDLGDCWLVVAATDNRVLNRRIATAAEAQRLFVNVVDDAELSSFHVPAIVDRGLLQIAISTGGAAPALGRRIRKQIELQLDESVASLVNLTARFRDRIKSRFPSMANRRRFYERLPESRVAEALKRQDNAAAEHAMKAELAASNTVNTGHVTLVGGGPGDPGLLTINGLRALQDADVILYDRLVSDAVLELARRDAELVSVGKLPGDHKVKQERINELLVEYAQAGHHVVRLKGGDPFIFGRGGEELEELQQHGIAFHIVPGITAASACATYAGIPLTHRDYSQSVRFVTGHCKDSDDTLDWRMLARENQTLAVYMGVSQLPVLQERLLTHGRSADTPFALIEQGTRAEQRVVLGRLRELSQRAKAENVKAPALLVLGEVAALADKLSWFGELPIGSVKAVQLPRVESA